MKKSVLVMETPENCYDCPFGTEYCGDSEYEGCCELAECLDSDMRFITEEHYGCKSESKPDWCPLKPLPEENKAPKVASGYELGYEYGWNKCLDKINLLSL